MKLNLKGEDAEQAALFEYASYQQHPWELLFSVPNGGKRHITTARRLKATGLKPGIPDVFLPVSRGKYHGMFIELKSKDGKVRLSQTEWHNRLREQNYKVVVCKSCDEAVKEIKKYLSYCITNNNIIY